jgi:hypothetical protein
MSETPSKQASSYYRNLLKERDAATRPSPSLGSETPPDPQTAASAFASGSGAATKPAPSDMTGSVKSSPGVGGGDI